MEFRSSTGERSKEEVSKPQNNFISDKANSNITGCIREIPKKKPISRAANRKF